MKVKCINLLNSDGQKVEFSPWLTLNRIYHVMAVHMDADGSRSFSIITHDAEGEWPKMGSHRAECFEIVSDVIPSNWREWHDENESGVSPAAWQEENFYEAFYDYDPAAYPIFEREQKIILSEDP